jgi:protein TonB
MKNSKSPGDKSSTKNEKLEKKRTMFFQMGLILTLAFVLAAFEWTTVRTHSITDWGLGEDITIEEFVPITKHETPKPKPNPALLTSIIEIIDDQSDLEVEDIVFEEPEDGLNDIEFFIDDEKDEAAEEPVIFKVAETQPSFPGGEKALYEFLYDNLKYPEIAREAKIQGPVYVSFIVWNDGSVREVSILRGIGGGCDEEALRVVEMMPRWNPGLQRTMPVNVQMAMTVKFVLK